MLKVPERYEEDDTPSRFKFLMNPPAKGIIKSSQRTSKIDDEWIVRPGETFRQFNARIRSSGLSLPPGVPEATRVRQENPHKEYHNQVDSLERRPGVRVVPSEDTRLSGERTKQKRKAFLRRKDEAKRRKTKDDEYGATCNQVNMQRRHLRDVVQAPPNLKVRPKATLKPGRS